MQAPGAMRDRKVFRVSRVSVAISAQKAILAVKGLREISVHRVRQDQQGRRGQSGHREMPALRGPGVFQDRLGLPDLPGLWDRKV